MDKRKLGQLTVSALGLGCMGMSEFYGSTDQKSAIATLQKASQLGVNFFDTADMYGYGRNEILLGDAVSSFVVARDQVVIATKCGIVRDEQDATKRGLNNTPEYIKASCDGSLKRLKMDYVDLYYLHRIDPHVPIEVSMTAMAELVKAGKIRYIGLSEATAETIRRAHKIHPVTAIQAEYSLMTRNPEANGVLATCRELNIGFVPYSPICRGLLSSAIKSLNDLAEDDARKTLPRFQQANFVANHNLVIEIEKLARAKQCTVAQLALAWVLTQGDHIVPIPGTKRIKYLEENLNAVAVKLNKDDLVLLNKLFPLNVAAGDRYAAEMLQAFNME